MEPIIEYKNMNFEGIDGEHITIQNSDKINLQNWRFEIEFSIENVDKGCFIFDKRNGQWHRNYCFGYITEEWFKHHPCDYKVGKYLFVDIGDGRRIDHELNNGIGIKIDLDGDSFYYVVCEYNGNDLSINIDSVGCSKPLKMKNVKGNGNLVIGSMGEPHTSAFEQYGLGRFSGDINFLRFYDLDNDPLV